MTPQRLHLEDVGGTGTQRFIAKDVTVEVTTGGSGPGQADPVPL